MKKLYVGILGGIVLLGGFTLGNKLVDTSVQNHTISKLIGQTVTVSGDRPYYTNIRDLKKNAEVVVLGSVQKQGKTYNLAKDPNDPSKDNPDFTLLGTDFEVKVDKYLKGKGESIITLTQEGGEDGQTTYLVEGRSPLIVGGKYIFFLNEISGNKYMFGGDPYRFKITNGKASVDTDNKNLRSKWQEKPEKDLITEIENN